MKDSKTTCEHENKVCGYVVNGEFVAMYRGFVAYCPDCGRFKYLGKWYNRPEDISRFAG